MNQIAYNIQRQEKSESIQKHPKASKSIQKHPKASKRINRQADESTKANSEDRREAELTDGVPEGTTTTTAGSRRMASRQREG
jgi:hypothetical protein